eukprot:6461746-Amphidinium_carterae.1
MAQNGRKRGRELLGVALVGLGRSGQFHLTSIRTMCHMCKLIWAIDVDEQRAQAVAEEMECKHANNIDGAVQDPNVDIVIIASTTDTHFPFIMKSLGAKKAVFAEKPISHNVKEVEAAIELALKNRKPFICGYQRRCDLNFMKMKQDIDDGRIGTMKMLKSCSRDNPVPPVEYLRTSGGIFQDMLIHDFDMHDWVTGGLAPESVTAVGHCYSPQIAEIQDLDTVGVMCKYSTGLVSMIDTSRDATYGYDQRMEVFGSKGMLHVHNQPLNSVEFADGTGFRTAPALWSFPERYKGAYLYELD